MGGSHSSGAFNAGIYREIMQSSKGRLPHPSSLTFEGIMKEYFYKTGMEKSDKLMEAAYSIAVDSDPISLERQVHLALGLHSSEDGKNERRDLNLVIVLDISGSMQSTMSSGELTKIQVASQVICELIDNLNDFERLGIVLFDDIASTLQPLTLVQDIDKKSLKETVMKITARNGTDFSMGMKKGIELFSSLDESDSSNSNRIIYLTDACPTIGGTDTLDMLTKDANCGPYGICSTFIGVGLDFNTEIIEALTKVRGCNYFSVKSNEEFKKILNDDFNYIVSPICFNVKLIFESEGFEIEKCFGTNMADESTNEIMKVDTCSAGQLDERGVKGGIILVRLKPKNDCKSSVANLTLSYETSDGKKVRDEQKITINTQCEQNYYQTNGIRKAISIVRYVEIVKGYLNEMEVLSKNHHTNISQNTEGLTNSPPTSSTEWNYKFKELLNSFTMEMNEIGDEEMQKEVEAIKKFIEFSK